MILGDSTPAVTASARGGGSFTLDEVFRRSVERHPHAPALVDATNRARFTDGAPRRLTFAEADRAVTAVACRLRRMGLPTDAIIGIQLPNIVEAIVAILGVLRAGMIAAPLPLLWRRADTVTALGRIGAKALVTCGRVGAFDHAQFARQVAAEVFSIRYVCSFGDTPPDGVVAFADLLAGETPEPSAPAGRHPEGNGAAHLATVTFDVAEGGPVPVARSHDELLAGGLAVVREGRFAADTDILSAFAPSSFAGLGLTLLPWLLTGGTLVLHQPFDPALLMQQQPECRSSALILPAAVAFACVDAAAFAAAEGMRVIAAWRAPERLAASPTWRRPDIALVDVPIFGEIGFIPARRALGGRPSPIPVGAAGRPLQEGAGMAVEAVRTDRGTVALRGAMVPRHAFPPGIAHSELPHLKIGSDGFVDTGYACRVDSASKALVVTAPPLGIVSVGGYRFAFRDLQSVVGGIDDAATLAALPDPLVGQRLIGNAADRLRMQTGLDGFGANPLVVAAFRDRSARGV
jgi:non-ribosomal peptide synthetase component F